MLRPGYLADIVIFDHNLRDRATFEHPQADPEGLQYVIIHGEIKVNQGEYGSIRPGQIIRKSHVQT